MKLGNYYVEFTYNKHFPETLCTIYENNNYRTLEEVDSFISDGTAYCSYKDQFSKKIGRKIALTKAIKELIYLSKEERKQIWNDYFKYCKK